MTAPEQDSRHPGPTRAQHRSMHRLWRLAGVSDRGDRLALTGAVIGRDIRSSAHLTEAEADRLTRYMLWLLATGRLTKHVARWLGQRRAAERAEANS